MADLGLDGLASGFPTEDIINTLMQYERAPISNLAEEKSELQIEKDAWRDVNTRVSHLEDALTDLKLSSTFNSNTASSSKEEIATATAASDAANGSYNLSIDKLANVHRIASDTQVDSTGSLELSGNIKINGQTVSIEESFSLNDISTAINETENIEAEASVINNTLVLESSETGVVNQLQVEDDNSVLKDLGILSGESSTNVVTTAEMSASSQYSSDYPVESLNDGITDQTNWGNDQGWNDATANDFTNDSVTMDFGTDGNGDPVVNTVDKVVVNTRDDADHPASSYGVRDYEIQHWDSNTDSWKTAATVTDNEQGEITTKFDAVKTNKLRIKVNDSNDGKYSRLVEVEAYNTGEEFKNVLQAPQDASLSINGVNVNSVSNQIEDAVDGVNFNIKDTGSATVEVSADKDSAVSAVQSFVDQYNSIMDFINNKINYDSETDEAGTLQGDNTLMSLQMKLRNQVMDMVDSENSGYNSLGTVGITIDREGVMSFDSSKLEEALEDNADAVTELFNAESSEEGFDGVATRMDSYVDNLVQTNTGVIPNRLEFYDNRMENIEEDIESYERRAEATRERYVEQFTAMEEAISEMQQQQSWMSSQLSSLGSGGTSSLLSSMM